MWTEDWGTLLLQTLETPSSLKALAASSSEKTWSEEADCSKDTGHCSAQDSVQSITYIFSHAETWPLAD